MNFIYGMTFEYTDFHEGKDRTRQFKITQVWGTENQTLHFHDIKKPNEEIIRTEQHLQDNYALGKIKYASVQHLLDYAAKQKKKVR